MKRFSIVLIINLVCIYIASAQKMLSGYVATDKDELLVGATVLWQGTTIGAVTDVEGHFLIPRPDTSANLLVTFVGYNPMTVRIEPDEDDVLVQISGMVELQGVQVNAERRDNFVSALDPRNVEHITSNELKKAPCCNLSEAFETNGSVDIAYTDGVTGAKEVQMLGLRGIYTQMTIENRGAFGGLATPYALEYIPGSWLESIQINKGAGSVTNGFQSIAGQINAEIVKPHRDKKVFVNLYAEANQRVEANLHLNKKMNHHWSHGLLLHGNYFDNAIDNNKDGFYDAPLKKQLNGMYRVFYEGEKWCGNWNIQALTEQRKGGQIADVVWSIGQKADRVEFSSKVGYKGFNKEYQSAGSQWSALYHNQTLNIGNAKYAGMQRSLYANLLYASIINNTNHKLTSGASFQFDDYVETLDDADLSRREVVPGIFGEYTYQHLNKELKNNLTLVLGMRADYHNIAGLMLAPRANLKYNPREGLTLRASVGRGYRMSNLVAENISLLASNKPLVVEEPLRIEDAWNMGANGVYTFKILQREASLSADLYRTVFQNQVIVDMDSDPTRILAYNLNGQSYSNSLMTMFQYAPSKGLDLKFAYKTNDVKTTYRNDGLQRQPYVPQHRGLISASYETPKKLWRANLSTQIVGPQRLPAHHNLPTISPTYALVNAQVTRILGAWEVYLGTENIGNYVQPNPIIGFDAPLSAGFDATRIYAPILGRRIYAGLRWSIAAQADEEEH